mmetsp:Transcript_9126/g.22672  ORF Transcript_9126/g.22672 Transcript_9126/m.22672 type:complete len:266 (-) Transcript_9126:149-946(-)
MLPTGRALVLKEADGCHQCLMEIFLVHLQRLQNLEHPELLHLVLHRRISICLCLLRRGQLSLCPQQRRFSEFEGALRLSRMLRRVRYVLLRLCLLSVSLLPPQLGVVRRLLLLRGRPRRFSREDPVPEAGLVGLVLGLFRLKDRCRLGCRRRFHCSLCLLERRHRRLFVNLPLTRRRLGVFLCHVVLNNRLRGLVHFCLRLLHQLNLAFLLVRPRLRCLIRRIPVVLHTRRSRAAGRPAAGRPLCGFVGGTLGGVELGIDPIDPS